MAATLTTALTGEEITILKSYKRSRFSLVQHKAEALLLLEDGVTLDIIARFVERQPSTITTWITDFNRLRTASLFTGHAANTNVVSASTLVSVFCHSPIPAPIYAGHSLPVLDRATAQRLGSQPV